MDTTKSLFTILIVVLLVSVIGIALRETIVGKMCTLSDAYSVTYANASGGADITQTFDSSGIDCETNGLLYTWGLVLVALASVVGLIYTAVKQFKN